MNKPTNLSVTEAEMGSAPMNPDAIAGQEARHRQEHELLRATAMMPRRTESKDPGTHDVGIGMLVIDTDRLTWQFWLTALVTAVVFGAVCWCGWSPLHSLVGRG